MRRSLRIWFGESLKDEVRTLLFGVQQTAIKDHNISACSWDVQSEANRLIELLDSVSRDK